MVPREFFLPFLLKKMRLWFLFCLLSWGSSLLPFISTFPSFFFTFYYSDPLYNSLLQPNLCRTFISEKMLSSSNSPFFCICLSLIYLFLLMSSPLLPDSFPILESCGISSVEVESLTSFHSFSYFCVTSSQDSIVSLFRFFLLQFSFKFFWNFCQCLCRLSTHSAASQFASLEITWRSVAIQLRSFSYTKSYVSKFNKKN